MWKSQYILRLNVVIIICIDVVGIGIGIGIFGIGVIIIIIAIIVGIVGIVVIQIQWSYWIHLLTTTNVQKFLMTKTSENGKKFLKKLVKYFLFPENF